MTETEIDRDIVDSSFQIHSRLGPGLLESVYETVLAHELVGRGLHVVQELPDPVVYDGVRIEMAFKADIAVCEKVIVEVKSVDAVVAMHRR